MPVIGRIVRPHGNKGGVVVHPETDFGADRFQAGARVFWRRRDVQDQVVIADSRERDGRWVVRFEGVTTIDEAESLRDLELRIPEEHLRPLAAGRFYVHDLVGCRVETARGGVIGRVGRVELSTGTPLLVVDGRSGEVLVPLAETICRRIDVAAKVIEIDPPDGLVELNETKRSRPQDGSRDDD